MIDNYLDKLYGGFLGMNVGIRLGAPVEPTIWTYERIQSTYGDITDYVKEYKNFAADDDANGPVFFLRALYDDACDRELTPDDVARAWLNYTRENKGMFWWGGYGISTEHTVFQNLKMGITAPQSGSIAQNGKIMAEQIGGQIFIDTWGLVCPDDPDKASLYGGYAASVSHDGDGKNGAHFFCAAIAKAFTCNDIEEIVRVGLSYVPKDSTYYEVSQAVIDFHKKHPDDFRLCREMLERDYGYDKYLGICHMIPNAGVCILSLLYGKGDFNRTVEIATMCGWDTDCNAGNVGTVVGVMTGVNGIAPHYRRPINDSIVLSSVSGYLNIMDIPSYVKELALLGYRLKGEKVPAELAESLRLGEINFDFALSGSTHNFRVSDPFFCGVKHSTEHGNSLHILVDRMATGQKSKIFYKPYYLRSDFSDERYMPVFSPTVYSGQVVKTRLYTKRITGNACPLVAPFVHFAKENRDVVLEYRVLVEDDWTDIEFVIPNSEGDLIDEVGLIIEGNSSPKNKILADLYMDFFTITGDYDYSIDFAKQTINFGSVSPFSHNYGAWEIADNALHVMCCEEADSYTGNYYATHCDLKTTITPLHGESHLLSTRVQGVKRGYLAGFAEGGRLVIYKNHHGIEELASCPFAWKIGETYEVELTANGNNISIIVNGKDKLSVVDDTFAYGMFGCHKLSIGRTSYGTFHVKGGV
ncbi:MAG: ADP-ribosylglycohydrolase family protein [Eubacteriales bacterium]